MAPLIQGRALTLPLVRNLPVLPDRLEEADRAAEPAPSADGQELAPLVWDENRGASDDHQC
jgi:hypothetical protein